MQRQPSGSGPSATSVADTYEVAYGQAFLKLTRRDVARLADPPAWDDDALCSMLADLAAVRQERLDRHERVTEEARARIGHIEGAEAISAHLDRIGRVAIEVAALRTLLYWRWIKDERLVRIGASILEQVAENDA